MELTRFGLWIGHTTDEVHYPRAAALAEELGFGTLWLGGSPRLTQVRPMLEASERIVIATGIVNVWTYDPAELAAEFAEIEADFPGRVLLGIGVGHPEATQEYEKPLSKARNFLDGIAASEHPVPRERMVLAALGPKMLELSYERTRGAHPYFTTPAHTKYARERLGPEALLAPEQAVVVEGGEADAAFAVAKDYAGFYLALSNYANNVKRFGYDDEQIADGGSRELIDEYVPQGSGEQLVPAVAAHLEAGADHVCVQALSIEGPKDLPERPWRELAAALFG
jgi:probable F420-dependent oxidoreductase